MRLCRRRMQFVRHNRRLRASLDAMASGAFLFTTSVGRATKDNEDLFGVGLDGRDVLEIPEQAKEMQARLMLCAHRKNAGYRGIVATF